MTPSLVKYPRTAHIAGSRLQPGDEGSGVIPFGHLVGRHIVIEEKVDGANCGIRFDDDGTLLLQSRGHFLRGGGREKHFSLLKQWASTHDRTLHERLGRRYVLYGEWLYARHTIFYDQLPHYFLEFDVLDLETEEFLSTPRRRSLLRGLPVHSVPVLHEGVCRSDQRLEALIARSAFIRPGHLGRLADHATACGLDPERIVRETDPSEQMEGLYVKIEEDGIVQGRFKYVRDSFLTAVIEAEEHWLHRPIVANLLAGGGTLFERDPA